LFARDWDLPLNVTAAFLLGTTRWGMTHVVFVAGRGGQHLSNQPPACPPF
jgi:hypothetical protein